MVSFYFYRQKSIPNFQRYFVSGLLFSFHNSQCGPRSLNVIMQRGRTGTISPLKPLYWHLQDKNKLLPASYTPHASFCLQLFSFFFYTFNSLQESNFIFTFCWQLEFSKWGKQGIYLIPQQKSLQHTVLLWLWALGGEGNRHLGWVHL